MLLFIIPSRDVHVLASAVPRVWTPLQSAAATVP